jgi:hypothetical protein
MRNRWSMRFKTRHPDGDNYDGVIVHVGRAFVVLREEVDFEFDGLVLLPKKLIRGFRDAKYETCANQILKQNGQLRRLKTPSWVTGCDTIPDFLRAVMQRKIWPGIEMLFEDGSTAYYLGPVTGVSKDGFRTDCYDAAGHWEGGYSLGYDEILKIEFGSRYCRHFNRYMRAKSVPRG